LWFRGRWMYGRKYIALNRKSELISPPEVEL